MNKNIVVGAVVGGAVTIVAGMILRNWMYKRVEKKATTIIKEMARTHKLAPPLRLQQVETIQKRAA